MAQSQALLLGWVWIFSSATAFAGVASRHELGLASSQDEEVVCWHAPLRTWPPEDTAAAWAAADRRQLPTEDCGRVHRTSQGGFVEGYVEEWLEHDLSGEAYEERWHRLQPAALGVDGGSIALARIHEAPFELLVVTAGRFGYFRDGRSSALVAELVELDRRGVGLEKLLLDGSRPIESRRAMVNCEASVGVLDGWIIEHAVLPWRVGTRLQLSRSDGWVDLTASSRPSAALHNAVESLLQQVEAVEL